MLTEALNQVQKHATTMDTHIFARIYKFSTNKQQGATETLQRAFRLS